MPDIEKIQHDVLLVVAFVLFFSFLFGESNGSNGGNEVELIPD
ncbi:hypothetical protein [Brevibacillus sp. SYSU BS000544]